MLKTSKYGKVFELEFYCLVNTIEVMSSMSVNLLTLFLGMLSPLSGLLVLAHIVLPFTENYPS